MKIIQEQLKKDIPKIRVGDTVIVYQKIKEKDKERVQPFEGLVIAMKHGKGINATITVRKSVQRIGVEKTYPIHSPTIEKIEISKHSKVRRAKLYYIRAKAEKEARKKLKQTVAMPQTPQAAQTEQTPQEPSQEPSGQPQEEALKEE